MAFERKPHKYNEAIKAWADGKPIQYKPNKESCWIDYAALVEMGIPRIHPWGVSNMTLIRKS